MFICYATPSLYDVDIKNDFQVNPSPSIAFTASFDSSEGSSVKTSNVRRGQHLLCFLSVTVFTVYNAVYISVMVNVLKFKTWILVSLLDIPFM